MHAVGIKNLKNKLSEYLRLAAAGERVLVTDHEVVIAEIGPPHGGSSPSVSDSALLAMIREGLITPAQNPRSELSPPVSLKNENLLEDLLRDRNAR